MRNRSVLVVKATNLVLQQLSPLSLQLAWKTVSNTSPNVSVAIVHFLARGKEVFCCSGEKWWQIDYHWYVIRYAEECDCHAVEIDRFVELEQAPLDVIYSTSDYAVCEAGDSITDNVLLYDCNYDWERMFPLPG